MYVRYRFLTFISLFGNISFSLSLSLPGVLATWTQEPVRVPYGFRNVHIRVCVDDVLAWKHPGHTISRAGCMKPTSGLYEARESLYEADRIQ